MIGRGGLGIEFPGSSPDWRITSTGQYVDCNQLVTGLFNAVCWGVGSAGYTGSNPADVTGVTPPAGVDCSQFSNLSNSQCTLADYLSSNLINIPMLALVGGAVVLLLLIRR